MTSDQLAVIQSALCRWCERPEVTAKDRALLDAALTALYQYHQLVCEGFATTEDVERFADQREQELVWAVDEGRSL